MNQLKRPSIEEIILDVNGKGKVNIPKDVTAIFFTNEGVNDILAPFYKNYNPQWQSSDAAATFGTAIANKIFKGAKSIPLTEEVVKTIWNTPDDDGNYVAYILKTPPCLIAGDR
jgi:hypothetical protein